MPVNTLTLTLRLRDHLRVGYAFCSCLLLMCLFGIPALQAEPLTSPAVIQNFQYSSGEQMLGFLSSARPTPQVQYLPRESGRRVVIDLPDAIFPPVRNELTPEIPGVEKVRISQFSSHPPAVRMVLDVASQVDVAIRTETVSNGFQTWIQPQNTLAARRTYKVSAPPLQLAALPLAEIKVLDVRQNHLYLEGTGPLYPEIRKLDDAEKRYAIAFYNVRSNLTGKRPELNSNLFREVQITNRSDHTEIQFKLTRDNVEIIPFSEEVPGQERKHLCTIQFLVLASTKNLAHLSAPEILEMGQQVTRLRIPSDRPFDYQTYLLEKPHRLVIDTQGTILGERESVREIRASSNLERIRIEAGNRTQNTDLRFILDLHGEVTFQHSYHNNYVEILIQARQKERPVPLLDETSRRAFIVLDAGHGGNDPGAIGKGGVREKEVTLAVTEYLKRYLENDQFKVMMTRAEDLEILLQPRVDVANLRSSDLFISVHCNSMPPNNEHVRGIETYYTTPQSKELADTLHQYLVKELGAPDRRVRQRGLFVTRKTQMPSVLLEIGFVSNPEEEALLGSSAYQRRVAKAIRDGIYDYLSRHKPRKTGGNL